MGRPLPDPDFSSTMMSRVWQQGVNKMTKASVSAISYEIPKHFVILIFDTSDVIIEGTFSEERERDRKEKRGGGGWRG